MLAVHWAWLGTLILSGVLALGLALRVRSRR